MNGQWLALLSVVQTSRRVAGSIHAGDKIFDFTFSGVFEGAEHYSIMLFAVYKLENTSFTSSKEAERQKDPFSFRRSLPYIREFDPLARDAEGGTPLHHAARSNSINAARVLTEFCPSSVDVLDDRNRTPSDLATGEVLTLISRTGDMMQEMSPRQTGDVRKQNVTSTALWVMTNGETVTDSHLLRDRRLVDEVRCVPFCLSLCCRTQLPP